MEAKDYQNKLVKDLRLTFGNELVEKEWDSVKYDPHSGNHTLVYAPRIDIAVGPFNPYMDLDIGIDNTKPMQSHPFTKRLYKDELQYRATLKKVWNSFSLCYLAIEIEFSGSSKHILGSIVNASISGSIGIIVANKTTLKKAVRISKYLLRLEERKGFGVNHLRNLIIYSEDEFSQIVSEIKH
jgi:hypothetical protein